MPDVGPEDNSAEDYLPEGYAEDNSGERDYPGYEDDSYREPAYAAEDYQDVAYQEYTVYEAETYTDSSVESVPPGYQPVYQLDDDEDEDDWEDWAGYEDLTTGEDAPDTPQATWVQDEAEESPPGAPETTDKPSAEPRRTEFELPQEPTTTYRSGSLYSFSYRNRGGTSEDTRSPESPDTDADENPESDLNLE
jgi:hypothetical protein